MFVLPMSRSAHRMVAPQFSRTLDRLFNDSLDRDTGGDKQAAVRTPALDVSETDTGYSVVFDVPGVAREQLKVSLEGRRVSIETVDLPTAEPAAQPNVASSRVLYRERAAARYARTVSLPAEVDQNASQARFENGVLTLTLAKKVPNGATRLDII